MSGLRSPSTPSPVRQVAPQPALSDVTLRHAVRVLADADPVLARIVDRHGPPPLWDRPPGFATLVRVILEQQVSLRSAAALFARLEGAMPGGVTPEAVCALGDQGLQGLGLTRQKARYVRVLAEQVAGGALVLESLEQLPDADAAERLTRVPGIGPWTASIYLLMALLRPDVWPPGDLALRRMLERASGRQGGLTEPEMAAEAERWRPWRAVAARILWHGYLAEQAAGDGRRRS